MLSHEENQLIRCQIQLFFAWTLGSIFLQIFLFKLGGLQKAILFDLIQYLFLLIFYLSSGISLKKFSSRTLMRLGLLLHSLGWVGLFILKEKSIFYLIPLGMIFGAGHGFYWSGFNLSQYILTHQKNREYYFGKYNFSINMAISLGPLLGGLIILFGTWLFHLALAGYSLLFFIIFVINSYTFFLFFKLPRHAGIKFSYKQIFQHQRTTNWKLVLGQYFFLGIWDATFNTLSNILIFYLIKSEALLGSINSTVGFLAGFISLLAGKLLARNKKIGLWGSLGVSFGILYFAFFQNWLGIIILSLSSILAFPFLNIFLSLTALNTIDEDKSFWQEKYHFFLEKDTVLGTARVLSYLLLYFLLFSGEKVAVAKTWMVFIAIFPLIQGLLLLKMRPKSTILKILLDKLN